MSFKILEKKETSELLSELKRKLDHDQLKNEISKIKDDLKGLISLDGAIFIVAKKYNLDVYKKEKRENKMTTKKTTTRKPTKASMVNKTIEKIDALIETMELEIFTAKNGSEFVASVMTKEMWTIANDWQKEYCETFKDSNMSKENKMEASNLLYEKGFSIRGKDYNGKRTYNFYRFYNE